MEVFVDNNLSWVRLSISDIHSCPSATTLEQVGRKMTRNIMDQTLPELFESTKLILGGAGDCIEVIPERFTYQIYEYGSLISGNNGVCPPKRITKRIIDSVQSRRLSVGGIFTYSQSEENSIVYQVSGNLLFKKMFDKLLLDSKDIMIGEVRDSFLADKLLYLCLLYILNCEPNGSIGEEG